MPTLYLTCGLPGSGKTTLARRIERERDALRLTADEWLFRLHTKERGPELDKHRDPVEQVQWDVARRVLELGCNVVVDWGLWSREERDHYRTGARELGARVVLCVLDPPRAELVRRLTARNAALPPGTFRIAEAELDEWDGWFERPTAAELALFDPYEGLAGPA
ncbi:AAA family ATPase [Streptomyces sp. NBC_01304]|uniref:AAA family ATPase n=1 Tax=Streptomyces sp. NBC_01304 TaxID=2903818 RepID=UPI002E0FA7DD|nr:AAA family ATPase [Streptomyces sp. NBC_01304]